MWLALVVAVVLVGLTVAAVLGRVDGSLGAPTTSLSYQGLPDGPLDPHDIHALRLDTGLRGYRMEQVDEVIDRLAAEIGDLRERLEVARTVPPLSSPSAADPAEGMPPGRLFTRPTAPADPPSPPEA